MNVIFKEVEKWDRARIRVTISFAMHEIRFKISKGFYRANRKELADWAFDIASLQPEDSTTLRCQIDNYANKASFISGTNKSRKIVLVEDLPEFLVHSMRDLFEAFCKSRVLEYDFTREDKGYENVDTFKAYYIFKYSNNWRESK